jgi:uncharacterized protein
MSTLDMPSQLPDYDLLIESVAPLALPIPVSELHGVLCGYLCAGAIAKGNAYLQALTAHSTDSLTRRAARALFELYAVSQQQMECVGFEFHLLLPDEHASLLTRAEAFSEWCTGFIQGLNMADIGAYELHDDEVQEALQHITEFSQLDYQSLQMDDEDDERSLMEVSEYTRMAVLHLHSDLQANREDRDAAETAH